MPASCARCASCWPPYGIEADPGRRAGARRAGGDRRQPSRPTPRSRRRPRAAPPVSRPSPMIPASASRRWMANPASIPPVSPKMPAVLPRQWRALRRRLQDRRAPPPHRAYFVSALALARPSEPVLGVEDRVDGKLVFPPRGALGFGYDAIFQPDGHVRTFGEMAANEKHGIPADGIAGAVASRPRLSALRGGCARRSVKARRSAALKSVRSGANIHASLAPRPGGCFGAAHR